MISRLPQPTPVVPDVAAAERRSAAPPAAAPAGPETATHCPYCSLQCRMSLTPRVDGTVDVAPLDFPTNRGGLCQKGWTSAALLGSPERLTQPLVRREPGGPLHPATWDEALDRVAAELRRVQEAHGREAVAVFGGGGLTNEKSYALGKFARVVLRTPNIDYNGRWCMSSAAAAGMRAFGIDRGLPFPLPDVARTGAILLVGSNVAETMPPAVRHLVEQRERGGSLVVVDPRLTATAKAATLHLQNTPGTDLALAWGLLHLAIVDGYVDEDYVAARTEGFAAVRETAASYWPERVERITGVPVAHQREAVRLLGQAAAGGRGAMVLTARGAEQHAKGTDTVLGFVNLALALGLPGRHLSGFGTLTGQGNGQGGREHGQKADQLPGYRRIDDPAARAHVAAVWGVDSADIPGPGRSAYELLDSLGEPGGPRAMLVMGSNIAVSAPRAKHVRRRLDALDFLVVCDFVMSETAALADVVLPSAQWAEEDGTMTNLEGRVLLRRRAVSPPEGVRTDLEILAGLADRLGARSRISADPAAVFDELARASAGGLADYSGVTLDRLAAGEALHWPCPDTGSATPHPGTPRLFGDRFATAEGLARFTVAEHRPPVEDVDADYPLYLTTGRVLQHYQSGAQTRRVPALVKASPGPFVEVHPDVAVRLGLGGEATVDVVTRRGRVSVPVRVSDAIRRDTVFMPFHWGGDRNANILTNPALDPVSRMPEFKVCAARLEATPS
jgi:assimilatory nitrate reductase catalytic subunit